MPTWDNIYNEINPNPIDIIKQYIKKLEDKTERSVIVYASAFSTVKLVNIPSPLISIIDDDMQGLMTCSKGLNKEKLDLILHTPGGGTEATKKIISYLRKIYKHIRVIIPHLAMSGGTLIACASDEILMGPYSYLGPTDPQIPIGNVYVPVKSVLDEYKKAMEEIKDNPQLSLFWSQRLNKIPLGYLTNLENMEKKNKEYLKQILKNYMFKDDSSIKDDDINKMANFLTDPSEHSSHGSGINFDDAKKLGLRVNNFSEDKELEDLILSIFHSFIRTFEITSFTKIITNKNSGKIWNMPTKLK